MNQPTILWRRLIWIAVAVAILTAVVAALRFGVPLNISGLWTLWHSGPLLQAALTFVGGTALLLLGTRHWLALVDKHALLNSREKLQSKDAIVIGTFFVIVTLFGMCVMGAAATLTFGTDSGAMLKSLSWALASMAVGGGFGFLLGHPRRATSEEANKGDRIAITNLLRTGLDDMVDWLVKGLTTVLLVNSTMILSHVDTLAKIFARAFPAGEQNTAIAFIEPVIVFFTLLGALAACLVTRTYLTGALSRADHSTMGAFQNAGLQLGEVLMLQAAQRSLTTRGTELSAAIRAVAEKLAGLSLQDLHSAPELAMWAKANSMLEKTPEALAGYEQAVRLSESDPALLLDYGVALHMAGKHGDALACLEDAHAHLSSATAAVTRKNIYKSLTFQLLYEPAGYGEVLKLVDEYKKSPSYLESGGLLVNEACAWGQRFYALALQEGVFEMSPDGKRIMPLKLREPDRLTASSDLKSAYDGALAAVRGAVANDSRWKLRLRELLESTPSSKEAGGAAVPDPDDKASEDSDLESFERFEEFRRVLDLPPYRDSAGKTEASLGPEKPKPGEGDVDTKITPPTVKDTSASPPGGGT